MRVFGSIVVIILSVAAIVWRERHARIESRVRQLYTGSPSTQRQSLAYKRGLVAVASAIIVICFLHIFGIA